MFKIKAVALALLAVSGLGLTIAPQAQASVLQFTYTQSNGTGFSFDQYSNPTPIHHSWGSTQVAVWDWSGSFSAHAFDSIIWYTNSDSGMFDTQDGSLVVFGPQVFGGTTAAPIFPSTGTFYGQDQSGEGCDTIWGKLTVKELSSVPEPGTLALFSAALGLLGVAANRRRRARG